MRFSLQTMLISFGVVGAILGIMGRLMTNRPEAFLAVMYACSTIVPFVLALGTIIWIGLTGKPVVAKAICAQCHRDLGDMYPLPPETCPRCKTSIGQPGSVVFVHNRKARRELLAWGISLVLAPIALFITVRVLAPSGNALQLLSNRRLLDDRLAGQADQPWVWDELLARLNKQSLSQGEVEEAIQELTAHMKKTSPTGWRRPLPWQHQFIQAAIANKLMSAPVLDEFYDVYFASTPVAAPLSPINEGKSSVPLRLEYGNPFGRSGLGVELALEVTQVLIDGSPVKLRQILDAGGNWSALCDGNFAAGEHEVTFDIDAAYVDPNKLPALQKSKTPISQWTAAQKRWTTKVNVPLTVIGFEKVAPP